MEAPIFDQVDLSGNGFMSESVSIAITDFYDKEARLLERIIEGLLGRKFDSRDIELLNLRKVFRFSEGVTSYDLLARIGDKEVTLGSIYRSLDMEVGLFRVRFDVCESAKGYFANPGSIYSDLEKSEGEVIRINRLLDGVKEGEMLVYRSEGNYNFRAHFSRWINNVDIEIILANGMRNIVPAEDWEIDKESVPLDRIV